MAWPCFPSRLWRCLASGLAVALIALPAWERVGAQGPTLDDVLARATKYAVDYQERFSGVVAEEGYFQSWQQGRRAAETRTLRSDVLLTRPTGGSRYVLFRDVFEVDGRQVRDRDERLLRLFLEPSGSTSRQVLRILDESARYNIGDIGRTINTPTLALVFLDLQYRERFRFTRSDDRVAETVRGLAADDDEAARRFAAADQLWVVAYEETARDTLIGTGAGGNIPATGRFWIDPGTGRIDVTELELRDATVSALVDVRYDVEPALGIRVPVAMRERYRDLRRNSVIEGAAAYSHFRRFQVTSAEVVADPTADPVER